MNTTSPAAVTRPLEDVLEQVREQFPSLATDTVFLENAGGSQVPRCVADAMHHYLLHTNVQLEANYPLSQHCTHTVEAAHTFIARFMNAPDDGAVILGASSTALITMLANCYRPIMQPGDEIVLATSGHETNISPWVKLAESTGATVRWWKPDAQTTESSVADLASLINERTRFVCCAHVSNLLGAIVDVGEVTRLAHDVGARVVVDGVAYAPHRAIDVQDWNVDYYFYSTYKVYGPHMAALYAGREALREIEGPNHFFISRDQIPYKFELGGCSYEGCAGLLALQQYLALLADAPATEPVSRAVIERAFDTMTALELPLQQRLIAYFKGKPAVRIIGPAHAEGSRVTTVSFVHERRSSREISDHINAHNIGARFGHMYAYRLCEALGLDTNDGVVRISAVHYNSVDEIDRLIAVLDEVL